MAIDVKVDIMLLCLKKLRLVSFLTAVLSVTCSKGRSGCRNYKDML